MSLFKRTLISIWQRKGRTALFLGLFVIVFSLILSGFAIEQSAEKSKIDARKELGAEVRLKLDRKKIEEAIFSGNGVKKLSKDTVDRISNLDDVQSTQIEGEASGEKGDLVSVKPTKSEGDSLTSQFGMSPARTDNVVPTFKLVGTNNLEKSKDFKNHDAKLLEGEGITPETAENSAVIEETFAKNNKLKVGDTFNMKGFSIDDKGKLINYKVVGIYKNEKVLAPMEQMYELSQPGNQLYVDMNSYLKLSDQANIDSVTFYLKDPLKINSFLTQADKEMTEDDRTFKLDAHTEQYEQMIGPIEKMSAFSSIMIKVIIVAGGFILTLLSLLSVRDRKKEVGILLSLGEPKKKIITQLVTEILLIGVVAFGLSLAFIGASGQTISDTVLSQQVEGAKQMTTDTDEYDEYEDKTKDTKPVDKMDLQFNSMVVVKSAGLGLLLIMVTTLVPSIMISKTDPKDLFAQKE